MTGHDTDAPERFPPSTPTTPSEFDAALAALVRTAYDNGVDVEGSWPYRHDGSAPDYEIVIARLAKRETRRGD